MTIECHICGRTPRPGLQWWRRRDWDSWNIHGDLCMRCAKLPFPVAFNLLAKRQWALRLAGPQP